ncbi:MAG: ComEC/Rec2 family competence protein [Planctomycetota bacterium]|nr:ComEC/Rec2 family competence protein [Planctomycetota bacterium]
MRDLAPSSVGKDHERSLPPRRYQPLVVIVAGFCFGIWMDRCAGGLADGASWSAAIALLIWSWCYCRRFYRPACCSLVIAIVAMGATWHDHYWSSYLPTEIGRCLTGVSRPLALQAISRGTPLAVPGPIAERGAMDTADPEYRLALDVVAVRDGLRWKRATGQAICLLTGTMDYVQPGDRLHLWVHGQRIAAPKNPGEFPVSDYYRAQRTLVRLSGAGSSVRVLEPAVGKKLSRMVQWLRQRAARRFEEYLPVPQAVLASAILVGQRERLDPGRREAFLVTGTLHLLVVSGFHVGILASGAWLLGRLGLVSRRKMLWIVILLAIGYAILTGGRSPVSRATTWVVVICGARLCGRPIFAANTIALAGLLLLIRNPGCLFDPGTQLSFLAVLALARGLQRSLESQETDPLDQLIRRSRPWWYRLSGALFSRGCRLMWLSLLIWAATAPLVLYHFHVLSYTSVVLNLVLYVPMVLVMFSGLVVLSLGQIRVLAMGAAWVCRANLLLIESIVQWFQGLDGSHTWGPGLPATGLLLCYLLAGLSLYWLRVRDRHGLRSLLILLFMVVAGIVVPLWHGQWLRPRDGLRCTFIAVGHGTSVLLEMPGGENWLYDAGSLGKPETAGRRIAAVLWSRGIRRLDRILISHADVDHYNALPYLLNRFEVRSIGMPSVMARTLVTTCPGIYRAGQEGAVPFLNLQAGDLSWVGSVRIAVMHPPDQGVPGSDNANSLVISTAYQGQHLILPGDVEGRGLERLLASPLPDCSILMAPHHGSLHSAPDRVAEWSQPEWVILSSGRKPGQAEVMKIYRDRGARVWSTADHGAVTVSIDAEGKRLMLEH